MPDFITLSCPSCGAKLQITSDLDRFACGYCGQEQIVKRAGGIVSLQPVVEGLQRVQAGVDKTASELAIRRLNEEIAYLEKRRDALQPSSLLLLLGLPLMLFGVVTLSSNLVTGIVLILFGVGVLWLPAYLSRKEREPIEREVAAKWEELNKHKAIVDR